MNKILIEYIENVFHHLYNELLNNKQSYRRISNIIKKYFLVLLENPVSANHFLYNDAFTYNTYRFCNNIYVYSAKVSYYIKNKVVSYYSHSNYFYCRFHATTKHNGYSIDIQIVYEKDI